MVKIKITTLALALVVLPLSGCFEEKVYTIAEFKADPEHANKVAEECENNPGESMTKPNCINAVQARSKLRMEEASKEFRKGIK